MRRLMVLVAMSCLSLAVAVGCSTQEGSQAKFCADLSNTGDLMSILNDFSSTDPAILAKRFSTGLEKYRQLERDAPRSIRPDVASVANEVQQILTVVQNNPDDLSAIRKGLTASEGSMVSAAKSAYAVSNYARDKCGLNLTEPNGGQFDPAGGSTTTTTP